MTGYESVIGLEVHVQIKTNSKLFCACETDFGAAPNSHVCPVCTGQPGVLPVLNEKAVEGIVKVGLAFGCSINKKSFFARKQYFYPDLPKAYQISQSDKPFCENGTIDIETKDGIKTIRIQRIHLEEDAGKLLHSIGSTDLPFSLVDLNRSSIPLMEIVSHPDLSTPEEAYDYLTHLKSAVQYVGVSDCDMEKGSLRCDANISIRPRGTKELNTRVEVKNMNSFRSVKDAISFEIHRQVEIVESGGRVIQETRLWNETQGASFSMRSKEEAHDYRYFPDPDLVPVVLDEKWLEDIRRELPELPTERLERLVKELGLSPYDAGVLVGQKELVDYFEVGLGQLSGGDEKKSAKALANWLTTELLGMLKKDRKDITASPVKAGQLAELVELVQSEKISGKMGKEIFAEIYHKGGSPKEIVEKRGLSQVSDEGEISKLVDEVMRENEKIVQDIKNGKDRAIGSLVGQLMKKTKGQVNPQKANELFRKKILE